MYFNGCTLNAKDSLFLNNGDTTKMFTFLSIRTNKMRGYCPRMHFVTNFLKLLRQSSREKRQQSSWRIRRPMGSKNSSVKRKPRSTLEISIKKWSKMPKSVSIFQSTSAFVKFFPHLAIFDGCWRREQYL